MSRHRLALIVIALAIFLVLVATLPPSFGPKGDVTRPCLFLCGERGMADFLVNIVLYAPLGVGLHLWGASRRTVVLLPFLLAAAIETVQIVVPGRDSSAGDVLANTLGAILGFATARAAPVWWRPAGAVAAWFSFTWAALIGSTIVVAGYLAQPSLPAGDWYGQWTPRFEGMEPYEGEILAASVGGLEMLSRRHPQSDSVRALLERGAWVDIVTVAGPTPAGLAPIFSIVSARQQTILAVGADRHDLRIRYRQQANDARLDAPDIRLRAWLEAVRSDDTVNIRTRVTRRGLCVAVNDRQQCRLGTSFARAWGFLFWLPNAPPWLLVGIDLLWAAGFFLPLGLWWPGRRSASAVAWGAATVLAAGQFVFVSVGVGLQAGWVVGLAGAVLGLGAGRQIGRAVAPP